MHFIQMIHARNAFFKLLTGHECFHTECEYNATIQQPFYFSDKRSNFPSFRSANKHIIQSRWLGGIDVCEELRCEHFVTKHFAFSFPACLFVCFPVVMWKGLNADFKTWKGTEIKKKKVIKCKKNKRFRGVFRNKEVWGNRLHNHEEATRRQLY